MLLCRKLVDVYVALDEETRTSLPNTNKVLMESARILRALMDSWPSIHVSPPINRGSSERLCNESMEIKLFTESYLDEEQTSAILLQRFLTGISLFICLQLLLKGKPMSITNAITDATNIEGEF